MSSSVSRIFNGLSGGVAHRVTRLSQCRLDERPLRFTVAQPIVREHCRQLSLQYCILQCGALVAAQPVAKQEVVAPQCARPADEMNVMRARRAPPKVVSAGNASRAAVFVAKPANRGDVRLARCPWRDADQNV